MSDSRGHPRPESNDVEREDLWWDPGSDDMPRRMRHVRAAARPGTVSASNPILVADSEKRAGDLLIGGSLPITSPWALDSRGSLLVNCGCVIPSEEGGHAEAVQD